MTEVARLALKLGFTAFGGPAAHIAMLHDEVVTRRRWLTGEHFLDLLGATNLIPGPNSTEMVMHVGQVRAGWRGLILAGSLFILPAASIVVVVAWAYVEYGSTPAAGWLLYGIKPVIIAVVVQALWVLSRTAVKGPLLALVGVSVPALYLLGLNEIALLFGGGLLVMLAKAGTGLWRGRNTGESGSGGVASFLTFHLPVLSSAHSAGSYRLSELLGLAAMQAQAAQVPFSLLQLFFTFLKIGAVLYGSGYVLLAFLRKDFVERLGWLTDQQLLDAIAVGQFTPGPLFTTATFVGYVAGSWPGAVLATIGIFLPSFIFVAVVNPIVPRLRSWPWVGALLDGVNVSALGLMAAVTLELGQAAIVDWLTLLLALAAAGLLIRFKLNSAWLVLLGGTAGLLRYLLG